MKGATMGAFEIKRAAGHIFIMAPGPHGEEIPVAEVFAAGSLKEQEANAAMLAAAKDTTAALARIVTTGRITDQDRAAASRALRQGGWVPA